MLYQYRMISHYGSDVFRTLKSCLFAVEFRFECRSNFEMVDLHRRLTREISGALTTMHDNNDCVLEPFYCHFKIIDRANKYNSALHLAQMFIKPLYRLPFNIPILFPGFITIRILQQSGLYRFYNLDPCWVSCFGFYNVFHSHGKFTSRL